MKKSKKHKLEYLKLKLEYYPIVITRGLPTKPATDVPRQPIKS